MVNKMIKMNSGQRHTFLLTFCSICILVLSGRVAVAQQAQLKDMQVLADTLFQNMSIDELKKIQQEYQNRVQTITGEEEKMREMGLEVTETLLHEEGQRIKDQDKILVRMAEYYIEKAENEYFAKQEEYDKEYEVYLQKLDQFTAGLLKEEPVPPENVKYDYSTAVAIYDRIVNDFPQSEFADDALYNKAFLLQRMGEGAEARRIYQEVIDRYPDSHFAAESYMRLAEYFFDPREDKDTEQSVVELQKAIKLYQKVLEYKDSRRYDEALYKLGWSYYRLTATDSRYYTDAIVYFMAVVDDITMAEKMDPQQKISSPNVKQEAIQYIGISFTDEENYAYAGVQNARGFIERLGGREYGVDIMRAIGQTFQTIEKNDKAITAYQTLLEMYPYYYEAPVIKQKIADTYYALGKDEDDYRTRYELFRDYNPNSDWYKKLQESELPDKLKYEQEAYALAQKALFTNVGQDLQKAQEAEQKNLPFKDLYATVANGCKEYLSVFATDSNAYRINWYYALILDKYMNQFDDAFEQYVHVSNDYLETEHQEEAANNAIFVADTLVRIAFGGRKDTTMLVNLTDKEIIKPEILTPEEKRLIEAYDNYIRLFPDGNNTPVYLAAAGQIYFNHKQFSEAKVYFKTLVNRFPGAKEKNIAMKAIMESYFALGQFKDSEFVAKRILSNPDLTAEQKVYAQKRLASSIFNSAKLLAEQGQFLDAAVEYKRVIDETPYDTTYAEAALFNSGLNYDKVKEWEEALSTYVLLADKYPKSKYSLQALGNAAEDYKELKQYSNAGKMYEHIYALNANNPQQAEVALYNASYYYEEGEDWLNTIRVNNQYIATYPQNEVATDLYFDNAGHYLKLDNLVEANRIYEEFATRYPDDPRSVEAFYRRGSYFLDHSQPADAKNEFVKAVQKGDDLSRRGKDPNRYYVGEALNSLANILYTDYQSIELRQPQSNLAAQQTRLKNLIPEITATNTKIIANGSIRSFEAIYKSAEIYEIFADKYAAQERNPNLDETKMFLEDKRINDESAALYDKAITEYKNAMQSIPLVASKFNIDIFSRDTTFVQAESDTTMADSVFAMNRAAKPDTTKQVALRWYNKATNKISSLYYKQAVINKSNIDKVLATPNPYPNDPLKSLIYNVTLIGKGVGPSVQQTIQAHLKNIEEGKTLGLNNKYIEESKRQLLLTADIPATELERSTFEAIAPIPDLIKEYRRLTEMEYGSKNAKGEDYPLVGDNVKQLIDYSKALAINTMDSYAGTLDLAEQQNIQNDLLRTTQDRMLRLAVELTDLYDAYHDSTHVADSVYADKFGATENYNYDDASIFFQDLTLSFGDYSKEVLEHAFQLKQKYDIKNLWANRLVGKLIKLDPATYAGSVEREKVMIESDDTWLYSQTYTPGYNKPDFNDSTWQRTQIVPSTFNQFADLGVDPKSMWIAGQKAAVDTGLHRDSTGTVQVDTSKSVMDTSLAAVTTPVDTTQAKKVDTVQVYFRKKINLNGTAVTGIIYLTADNDLRLFINEQYILDDAADNFTVLDSVDFSVMQPYLKSGENIFAMHVVDTDATGGGVKIYGHLELIPLDIMAAMEQKTKLNKLNVDPVVLKKINTLNKNRITINN
jgi:tetratricopeptide (TPR) repeat protein